MINKINKFMKKYNMLNSCSALVVGVSGGADSVCLLHVLNEIVQSNDLDVQIIAVHVNHGIRGEEAARDEEFTKQLCQGMGIKLFCRHVDVPAMKKNLSLTEEEAGRKARYAIFEEIADGYANAKIAVAHHKNDQAETVLMNLFRGCSLQGLCGIQPVRGRIIRPLLCVSRDEIESYLLEKSKKFIVDSTNTDNEYTRNLIRNVIIPELEQKINGAVVEHLSELSSDVTEVQQFLFSEAKKEMDACVTFRGDGNLKQAIFCLSRFKLVNPVIQRVMVRNVIEQISGTLKDVYRTHIDAVVALCNQQVGKRLDLGSEVCVYRTYTEIVIECGKNEANKKDSYNAIITHDQLEQIGVEGKLTIPVGKYIFTENQGKCFVKNIIIEKHKTLEVFLNNVYTKYFDYDKIKGNICIRYRQEGDRIVIHPAGDSKKLKKELIDRKIAKDCREQILLLAEDQNILWAIGIRRSECYRVEQQSVGILKISVDIQEEE
jgi:tRNA(Ile)-lysidine synthase